MIGGGNFFRGAELQQRGMERARGDYMAMLGTVNTLMEIVLYGGIGLLTFFLLGGAPTDNNAKILRQGQMKVLQPAIDKGDVKTFLDATLALVPLGY